MIRSMTGYGRASDTIDDLSVTVEIKSVNNRYLDFSPKVYRGYSFLEDRMKNYVRSVISRGKVDCVVQIENLADEEVEIELNEAYAVGYYNALKKLSEKFGITDDITVSVMAKNPEIFRIHKAESDEEKIWDAVKVVLEKAVDAFITMREAEGMKLRADVLEKADDIIANVEFVEKKSPECVKEYREKLEIRMRELLDGAAVDETKLLTETAVYADKIAVDEETVRLRSHISQLRKFMDAKEPIGRKLDFLVQEINREANTIGSKAQNTEIANCVIAIKADVEKIREQIQNIE